MSALSLIRRSLAYHWRINLALAMGVAAATAVLTGALLVGDSVRGSLRGMTLDRLGNIDAALVTPTFFLATLADDVAHANGFRDHFSAALPAIMLQGTIDRPPQRRKLPNANLSDTPNLPAPTRRASRVSILGIDERFWQQGSGAPATLPGLNQVVLNEPLAAELQATVGDRVLLRLPQVNDIPADSPLGRKTATSRSRGLEVVAIIPAEGLGQFGIRASQQQTFNAFVSIETLQGLLEQAGKVNAILIAGKANASSKSPSSQALAAGEAVLKTALQPTLADYGIKLDKNKIDDSVLNYFNFSSDQMLLPSVAVDAIKAAFKDEPQQPVLVYLANYILAGDLDAETKLRKGKIPYSTVAAIDLTSQPPLGPFLSTTGDPLTKIADDEILLNRWAADDLKAQGVDLKTGDTVELTYFEPESTHGQVRESRALFKLAGVVKLAGPAADRALTPELKGVTDQESIANWDPPFPYEANRVRSIKPNDQDEQYWDDYKATPKAFISLAAGRKLWGSRFGNTTSMRIAARDGMTIEQVAARVNAAIDPAKLGFEFLPIKRLGLEASSGTTPFDLLFLGFSFFIIASAVMLIALLFKLNIDQRAGEIGILLATGISTQQTRRLLIVEGLLVASLGAVLGVLAGVGYAWLMLAGLRTWWLAAIVTPFLQLHVTPRSLAIGLFSGVIITVLTIAVTLRQLRKTSIRRLLSGQAGETRFKGRSFRWARYAAIGMIVVAAALVAYATRLGGEAQAGAFFGAGFLLLGGMLAWIWDALRTQRRGATIVSGNGALARLAVRNGARSPLRSTMTIGLIAAASFLIVAISAFRIDPPESARDRASGTGGYEYLAQSDQAIYQDLSTESGRSDVGLSDEADRMLAAATIMPIRVQSGDDASCLNLYQPRQPRVLGIATSMIERGGFAWAASAANESENPWQLLDLANPRSTSTLDGAQQAVPVVLDQNTAMYSLHLYGGVGSRFTIEDTRGETIELEVVGLLKNSIFQGDLLISEADFKRLFPEVSGYRLFLITPEHDGPDWSLLPQTLETALGDYGFDMQSNVDRLAGFMAVQNTYLSTFQSLGGLGLLLGTFGLATVQLRNVLERRSELALMRATGFRRRRLAELVMLENSALLLFGLGTGIAAALVAILPNLLSGDASIPWLSLALTLLLVLVVGLAAGMVAVRAVLRAPLLGALRGE